MTAINDIITHYLEYKTKMELVEKKMSKLRKQLKDFVKTQPEKKYDNGYCTVSLVSSKRTGICKKDIPNDLWNKYSVTTPFEMVCVRKKKSKVE